MAENETENGAAAPQQPAAGTQPGQNPQIKMNVLAQFVRDMSFENVLAQRGVTGQLQPDVQVSVNLDAKKRTAEHQYEILLKLKVDSKSKGDDPQQLFLLELEYVGVFHVEGVPEDQLHPFLLIECPRMLFPFARRIVSDVSRDGGFPPLNLETIDFVALYRAELQRRVASKKESGGTTAQA